jgi:hypothetical protein
MRNLAGYLAALLVVLMFFGMISNPFSGSARIMESLLIGFIPFLNNNIQSISWNAATWGPGLGAFLIAVMFTHRWLSRWALRTGRPWSFATSFCVVSLVPVLLVIAFLVPGVLLQWEMLRESAWIDLKR